MVSYCATTTTTTTHKQTTHKQTTHKQTTHKQTTHTHKQTTDKQQKHSRKNTISKTDNSLLLVRCLPNYAAVSSLLLHQCTENTQAISQSFLVRQYIKSKINITVILCFDENVHQYLVKYLLKHTRAATKLCAIKISVS